MWRCRIWPGRAWGRLINVRNLAPGWVKGLSMNVRDLEGRAGPWPANRGEGFWDYPGRPPSLANPQMRAKLSFRSSFPGAAKQGTHWDGLSHRISLDSERCLESSPIYSIQLSLTDATESTGALWLWPGSHVLHARGAENMPVWDTHGKGEPVIASVPAGTLVKVRV